MIFWTKSFFRCLAIALCIATNGCLPSGQSQLDEQKEPHFLAGKSRVTSLDYKGAVEEFEKAIEVNPRSASAHLELGLLFEKNEADYAAAIYHLDRFLKLQSNSDYSEIVTQHIITCKQELAKTVSFAPVAQSAQRELERLTIENRELHHQLEAWQNYYAGHAPAPTNPVHAQPISAQMQPQTQTQSLLPQTQPTPNKPTLPNANTKTYTIKSGDSPYAIAKKFGVRLDALLAANPKLDPKRLQIGQTLNIPAP